MDDKNSDGFLCLKCSRTFTTKKGLKMHERNHEMKSDKFEDVTYIQKRIANTISVQQHRKNYPKTRFEDLQADSQAAYKEALLFEQFLKESLGLLVPSVTEKIKDIDESMLSLLELE